MRMIPPLLGSGATGSEIDVFNRLHALPDDRGAVVFSSLNLADHEFKKWGEIDFVVVSRHGLLTLEVKGGQVYCDVRGIWRYESRGRRAVERGESPMAQVSAAYFSLRNRVLYPSLGRTDVDAAPSGFGVLLARTSRRDAVARGLIGGAEMREELIRTSEDLVDDMSLSEFLSRVLGFWRDRLGKKPAVWTQEQFEKVCRAIRPWFDRVPPLSLSVAAVRQEQLALTEEQYNILDFCEDMPRVVCTGGAGCGKTLLAVECMRREKVRDPVLVTGTESLAAHLRSLNTVDAGRVFSFSELATAPSRQLREHGCLIVDEGQELTNPAALTVLSKCVRGGLENGRWRWFADPNHQVLKERNFDETTWRYLTSRSFSGALSRNCRNTPQIIYTVEAVTGASVGHCADRGQGPQVEFGGDGSIADQVPAAVACIKRWLEDPEIAPGDIALLSAAPTLASSSVFDIAKAIGIPCKRWTADWSSSDTHKHFLAAATIEEFRGLEAPFVVLCDITGALHDPRRYLYLGMTRANFGLLVLAEARLIREAAFEVAATRQSTTGAPK